MAASSSNFASNAVKQLLEINKNISRSFDLRASVRRGSMKENMEEHIF